MNIWIALEELERDHNAGCDIRESVPEILIGYAEMGCTKTDMAAILGVSRPTFLTALKTIDPGGDIPWPTVAEIQQARMAEQAESKAA